MKRKAFIGAFVLVFFVVGIWLLLSQTSVQEGYALIFSDGGGFPGTTALFRFRDDQGVLIWETGVEAVRPLERGKIYVEQTQSRRTAFALANPYPESQQIRLELSDSAGSLRGEHSRTLGPRRQEALFVDELFELPGNFKGTLAFAGDVPDRGIGVITLRLQQNHRGEPIFATLPVVPRDAFSPAGVSGGRLVFPQVGVGPTITTELVLIGSDEQHTSGMILFTGADGNPLELQMGDLVASSFPFEIEAGGVFSGRFTSDSETRVGYATVEVNEGQEVPAGSAIFQLVSPGGLVSEAGVAAALQTTQSRLFVDNRSTRIGVAVASAHDADSSVQFRLFDLAGNLLDTTTREFPANGHLPRFVDQFFPDLPPDFRGTLQVSSAEPFHAVTLKMTINQRGDPILTTLPVNRGDSPVPATLVEDPTLPEFLILPQIGIGSGLATDVLMVGGAGESQGSIQFFTSLGVPLGLTLGEESGSLFDYRLAPAGGLAFDSTPDSAGSDLLNNALPEYNLPIEPALNPPTSPTLDSPHTGGIDLLAAVKLPGVPGLMGCRPEPAPLEDTGLAAEGAGVYLHSGEFFVYQVDLEIPGRGFNWRFARKYRSGITYHGVLGKNWSFNYERRLILAGSATMPAEMPAPQAPSALPGDVVRLDGLGRVDVYRRQPDGSFLAPQGFYTRLVRNEDGSFRERDRHGNIVHYSVPDNGIARMVRLEDRHGNQMRFHYDTSGRLVRVIDTLSRPILYEYDGKGLLSAVKDFMGREIQFTHDSAGNLTAVTSPAVTDTPNDNDFPNGKTVEYTYSSNSVDRRLNHNLIAIAAPNEVAAATDNSDSSSSAVPRIRIEYDLADRVVRQTIGGTNSSGVPAGGEILYQRPFGLLSPQVVQTGGDPVQVRDRIGNRTLYAFRATGQVVRIEESAETSPRPPGSPFSGIQSYLTTHEFNSDGQLTHGSLPEGNFVECLYDEQNPDRFQQGNLRSRAFFSDQDRLGDQQRLLSTWEYEPIFNQVRTFTDARGHDPDYQPPNGGVSTPERYTLTRIFDYQEGTELEALAALLRIPVQGVRERLEMASVPTGLGDLNRDADVGQIQGNVVREEHPSARLLPDPSEPARNLEDGLQRIRTLRQFNRFGQLTAVIDPEENRTSYRYFPANDPDGDGQDLIDGAGTGEFGYLRLTRADDQSSPERNSGTNPEPANIQTRLRYDAVGNVVRKIDGRGVATDFFVNQLNQIVQITKSAATGLAAANPIEPFPLEAFRYRVQFAYDFNDNLILRRTEDRGNTSGVGPDAFVDEEFSYDLLDQLISSRREVIDGRQLLTRYRYDANGNEVLRIFPEGNAQSAGYDERDLLFQRTRGAQSASAAALLSPMDPANYDIRGGVPSRTHFNYDRNGNPVERVDAADTDGSSQNNAQGFEGDRSRFVYDGFDRLVSRVDSVGNQDVFQYDPAGNLERRSRFGPVGGSTPHSDGADELGPVSQFGVIDPTALVRNGSPLLAATEFSFDELNRLLEVNRLLFVQTTGSLRPADVASGGQDLAKGSLNPGATQPIPGLLQTIAGRVATRYGYDRASRRTTLIQDDLDTYRYFYDGAHRLIATRDPEENRVTFSYDDNHNLIEVDEVDHSQIPSVEPELFQTTFFYDSLNRLQKRVDNLGQTQDYRYDSRNNMVALADASGPPGPIVNRRSSPGQSPVSMATNAFGNVTRFDYDGINRMLLREIVLTASGLGDGTSLGATLEGVKNEIPTPDLAQGGGDGLITIDYEWDDNSLMRRIRDDRGNQTEYEYDNLNRRVSETHGECVPPNAAERCDAPTTRRYSYDPDHNLSRLIDETGNRTDYEYDALNRHIRSDVNRAVGVIGTTRQTFQYDGLSRLTRATDNNQPDQNLDDSLVQFSYDSLSRVFEERQRMGTENLRAISSGWRAENLRSSLTYPAGRRIEYTYDRLDRLKTLHDVDDISNLAEYLYIGPSRVLERRFPQNGTRLTYLDDGGQNDVGYDALRRPVQLRHLTDNGTLIVGFKYSYDRMNNRRIAKKLHAANNSEVYEYDSAYRLTRFQRGELNASRDGIEMPAPENVGGKRDQTWILDGAGNWSERTFSEFLSTIPDIREHSSFNEVISQRFAPPGAIGAFSPIARDHDGNGNEIAQGDEFGGGLFGGTQYEWDFENRLRTIRRGSGEPIAAYTYDALGRRIRKATVEDPETTHIVVYFLDGPRILHEETGEDGPEPQGVTSFQQFVFGAGIDEVLVVEPSTLPAGSRLFYHAGTLGSVYALTDSTGLIVEGYQYDPYGAVRVFLPESDEVVRFGTRNSPEPGTIRSASALGNPYTFTGRRLDEESGLYYFRFRYLDTFQGRFINRDPIGMWADVPHWGNAYSYAGNNPVNVLDPLGTQGGLSFDRPIPGHPGEMISPGSGGGIASGGSPAEPAWPQPESEPLPELPDDTTSPVPGQPGPIPAPGIPQEHLDEQLPGPLPPLPSAAGPDADEILREMELDLEEFEYDDIELDIRKSEPIRELPPCKHCGPVCSPGALHNLWCESCLEGRGTLKRFFHDWIFMPTTCPHRRGNLPALGDGGGRRG